MRRDRIIQGRGVLECAGTTTTATYILVLSSDPLGNPTATGFLLDVDIDFAIDESLFESFCRLRLEDNQEIVVRITLRDDGSLLVQSNGVIPELG